MSLDLIDDLRNHDQGARIAALHRALLVIHSPIDQVVGIENAGEIFAAAKHPKSFVSLDDADHLLTRPRDAEYVARVVAGWSSRYVAAVSEETPPADGTVKVTETGAGKFQVEVEAGGTRLFADEPHHVGGLGSGPTPYELVSAGLGACTAMTLRLYSERKGLPLERASVAVRHGKTPDAMPADLFEREIALEGPLDDAQRDRLLAIAEKCPVHHTLEAGARVQTRLLELPASRERTPQVANEHYAEMEAVCREDV